MAKFAPKKTDLVNAEHWDYNSAEQVAVFMQLLADYDLGVSFCVARDGGVAAEIHKQGVYHFDVEPWGYLVIEADGSIKQMTENEFADNYGPVS